MSFLAALWLVAAAVTAPAEALGYDPVLSVLDVRGDVAPREARLGQEMVFSAVVTHPVEGSIGFAEPFTGGTLTVKTQALRSPRKGQAEVRVVLAGFALGEHRVPPLALRFTGDDGVDHPFQVLGGKVSIVATTEAGQAEKADLIAPVPIYRWNTAFLAVLAGLVIALGGAVWWLRRRPPRPAVAPQPVDKRTPAQRALDAIFQLQTSGMLERREVKAFTYALDDIVRGFLTESYGRGEAAQTTEEFLAALGALPPAISDGVRAFFDQGDRVRFAGEDHEIAEARQLCELAIALVTSAGAILGGGQA